MQIFSLLRRASGKAERAGQMPANEERNATHIGTSLR